jgi:hypothetical protein
MSKRAPSCYYVIKIRVGEGHWETIGTITGTLEDAREERDRLMTLRPLKGAYFSVWQMRCDMVGQEEKAN